ncbi:hypothetical protein Bca4012_020106 [Brassica carinata]
MCTIYIRTFITMLFSPMTYAFLGPERHHFSSCLIGRHLASSDSVKDCSTWRPNKYINVSEFPGSSSSEMKFWGCLLLYCVPICYYLNAGLSCCYWVLIIATLDYYVGPRTEYVD